MRPVYCVDLSRTTALTEHFRGICLIIDLLEPLPVRALFPTHRIKGLTRAHTTPLKDPASVRYPVAPTPRKSLESPQAALVSRKLAAALRSYNRGGFSQHACCMPTY